MCPKKVFLIFFLIPLAFFQPNWVWIADKAFVSNNNLEFSIKLLWFTTHGYHCAEDWPVLVDINSDSNLEIIAEDGRDHTVVFSHDGKVLANFSIFKYAWNPHSFVVDCDHDGRLECFFPMDTKLFIIDLGLLRIDDIVMYPNADRITGMIYGNWDDDEDMELLISYYRKGLFMYDFEKQKMYFLMNESLVDSQKVSIWGYLRPLGNGKVIFLNSLTHYCALGAVDILSRRVLWAVNISELGISPTVFDDFLVGDFDGDGIKEIVIPGQYPELYVFSSDRGELEACFNFTDYAIRELSDSYFAVCDLDGDGVIEGLFACYPLFSYWSNKSVGFIAIINMRDYTVKKVITYLKEKFGYSGIAPYTLNILDVNLDGVYDILTMNCGNLTIYDGRTLEPMFTFNVSILFRDLEASGYFWYWGTSLNRIVVWDIDSDGRMEIINIGFATISVFRFIIEPFLVPLIYWNPPYGYLNAFGCFENFDRDHDRVADWVEAQFGFSNNSVDSDGDGVSDFDEILSIYRNMSYGNASPEYLWVFISLVFIPPIAITAVLVYCVRRRKNVGMRP